MCFTWNNGRTIMRLPHAANAEPLPLSQRQSRALAGAIVLSVALHAAALNWLPALQRAMPAASAPEVLMVTLQPAVAAPVMRAVPKEPVSKNPAAAMAVLSAPQAAATASPQPAEAPPPPALMSQQQAPEPAASLPPPLPEARTPPAQPVSDPSYADNPEPPYPLSAKRRGLEGRVILMVEILANGACGRMEVKHGSGHDILDQAAAEAVKSWRFAPARRGGEPFAAWVEIPVTYRLKN